jgi:hypothetical protein
LECGSALLCRFGFSFGFSLWAVHAPKQEKRKRRSKAPPHSTPKPKPKQEKLDLLWAAVGSFTG